MSYQKFTKDMAKTHTVLIPLMAQPHFDIISNILNNSGYKTQVLKTNNDTIAQTGVKYVHNDMCYPAILVIGQYIDALNSGKYDLNKVALLMPQTGGGCRASNYIFLLRKALERSGYSAIPVLSLNVNSLDENTFMPPLNVLIKVAFGLLYGDYILCLYNQARSYERHKGDSHRVFESVTNYVSKALNTSKGFAFENILNYILDEFSSVKISKINKPRVGIVGEIYLKYSPLGNNNLEDFLIEQGAEPVVSGLTDFVLACMTNYLHDDKLYSPKVKWKSLAKIAINYLLHKQKQMEKVIEKSENFLPPHIFTELENNIDGIINKGVKMGEGWLLSAEMATYIKHGINNIVCSEPFGCLPNHIVAKGVMANIREKYPSANVVTVDYDPGACKINQENRLNLMLMNARDNMDTTLADNMETKIKIEKNISNEMLKNKGQKKAVYAD